MSKEEIEKRYKALILPESKTPFHFEKKEGSKILAYNPICGDKFHLFTAPPFHFHGHGCALSKASGSLLMRLISDRPLTESRDLVEQFIQAVESGNEHGIEDPTLRTLVSLKNYDGREECILLTWRALLDFIKGNANEESQ